MIPPPTSPVRCALRCVQIRRIPASRTIGIPSTGCLMRPSSGTQRLPPDTSVQWLVREPRRGTPAARASLGEPAGLAGPGEPAVLPGQWASGAAALEHLATLIISQGETASRHLDDIWAAAQHQCFRLAWLTRKYPDAAEALGAEHEAWRRLPMALRFAVDSARRGRPRPALIDQSFSDLALTLNRPSIDIKEALQR